MQSTAEKQEKKKLKWNYTHIPFTFLIEEKTTYTHLYTRKNKKEGEKIINKKRNETKQNKTKLNTHTNTNTHTHPFIPKILLVSDKNEFYF